MRKRLCCHCSKAAPIRKETVVRLLVSTTTSESICTHLCCNVALALGPCLQLVCCLQHTPNTGTALRL